MSTVTVMATRSRGGAAAPRRRAVLGTAAACCAAIGLLAIAEQAHATIALVGNVGQGSCGSGTSLSVVVPSGGVAAGDTLIVRLGLRVTSTTAVSASDSKGNTYTVDADSIEASGQQRSTILSAYVATALVSGNTITVTFPASSSSAVVVDDFSGIAQATRVDASGTNNNLSATASASVTTTHANDIIVGAVSAAGNITFTQPGGWTPLTSQTVACGGAPGQALNLGAYQAASTTGTYTYNPSLGASTRWAAGVVAYKAAGANMSVPITSVMQPTASALTPAPPPNSQPASGTRPAAPPTPVVISTQSVTITARGDALITVRCPPSARNGCSGTITIRLAEPHARRALAARCARGCRLLGSAKYEARAGQKTRVRVHMASYGRRLLARHKALRVTLTATSVSGGLTASTVRTITLRTHRHAA
jgi:hypothetical protein